MAVGFDISGSLGVVRPDKGFTRASTPKIFKTEFGDGYEQRLANGINNLAENYSLSFKDYWKPYSLILYIFFLNHFFWTNYDLRSQF